MRSAPDEEESKGVWLGDELYSGSGAGMSREWERADRGGRTFVFDRNALNDRFATHWQASRAHPTMGGWNLRLN